MAALCGGIAIAAGACLSGFRGSLPAREMYRLSIPDSASLGSGVGSDGAGRLEGALAVAPFLTPGLYGERSIVFRIDDTQYGSYPSREWAIPLSDMLGVLSERLLQSMPLTTGRAVFDPPSRTGYAYVWRGAVREFEEVNRGRSVFVAVALEAQLLRASDDSLLWSGSISDERAVAGRATMPAIVEAISSLASDVAARLIAEARGAAMEHAATARAPR